jgi:hypothetical protein
MQTLGFAPERLESDLRILKQAADLESQAAAADEDLDDKVNSASDAWQTYQKETERIAAERTREGDQLNVEFTTLQRRRSNAQDRARQLRALQMRNWALFGEPEPTPEPAPGPAMVGVIPCDMGQRASDALPYPTVRTEMPRVIDGVLTYGPPPVDAPKPIPAPAAGPVPPDDDEDLDAE